MVDSTRSQRVPVKRSKIPRPSCPALVQPFWFIERLLTTKNQTLDPRTRQSLPQSRIGKTSRSSNLTRTQHTPVRQNSDNSSLSNRCSAHDSNPRKDKTIYREY